MDLLNRFKRVPYFFQELYEKITTSIAFYPSLLAFGFFLLTGLMIYLEHHGITAELQPYFPDFLLIKSWDVAQALLTTMLGALISLMVFSFSMVMVLLNNAASNFSPRILPGLIADKFHQFVLGFYLGTITYCLLFTINMTPSQPSIPLPGFSVLLGLGFGLTCLMLFVFFIHSISESVQVGKVLTGIRDTTLDNMKSDFYDKLSEEEMPQGSEEWFVYASDRTGYLRSIDYKALHKICVKNDLRLKVVTPLSKFLPEGIPLFACEKKIADELRDKTLATFIFGANEYSEGHPIVGFKQITEVAVKAMSPGINDPGTAITAIDFLTILFFEKMNLPQGEGLKMMDEEDGKEIASVRVWMRRITFAEVLTFVLAPLRQYSKHDFTVVYKMMEMLRFLLARKNCDSHFQAVIHEEAKLLLTDAQEFLSNPMDFQRIDLLYRSLAKTDA